MRRAGRWLCLALLLTVTLAPALGWAAAPRKYIPVSRTLPPTFVVPKQYTFRFSLWTTASAGTQVWEEQKAYNLTARTISHQLGSASATNPLDPADFSQQLYLQMEYLAGGQWVVLPGRTMMTFAAYSMYSANPGSPGQSCWDHDKNAQCDLGTEDINLDGVCDALDCQGSQGEPGAPGDQGPPGQNGAQGPEGPQGPGGPQGVAGPAGPTGPDGATGVVGAQGPKGERGLMWKGPWFAGATYAQDDGVSFGGSSWVNLAAGNVDNQPDLSPLTWGLLAQKGEVGVQGPQGAPGPMGATGLAGPQGDQGSIGLTGPAGAIGASGAQGLQGVAGPIGPQGPKGDQGDIGLQGTAGPEGPTGPQGPKGDQGDIGPPGLQGIQGDVGPAGPEGPAGNVANQACPAGQHLVGFDAAGAIVCTPYVTSGILYERSEASGPSAIYQMAPDGTGARALRAGAGRYYLAKYSPDRSLMVFASSDSTTGSVELFLMNADGTNVRQMTSFGDAYGSNIGRFVENGTKLWFVRGPVAGQSEIWEMNLDGTSLRQVTNFQPAGKQVGHFDLSPDGTKIYYSTQSPSWSPTQELYSANIDFSGEVQLTSNGVADLFWDLSPDGTRILFSRSEGANGYDAPYNVFAIGVDGSDETRLTTAIDGQSCGAAC